jgi:O-acetyl-ADP-ribose deacetylase (regulator of RNase III)
MTNIIQGSILDFKGDVIVNPANSFLRHGAGLARVIADAATPATPGPLERKATVAERKAWQAKKNVLRQARRNWWAEQAAHPLIATGDAGWTSAGRLPYKGIIHAVGPIWAGGSLFEQGLLYQTHRSALAQAVAHDCRSIAFPAISCGIFGFPVESAAAIARAACVVSRYTGEISFYLFEDAHFEAYQKAFA